MIETEFRPSHAEPDLSSGGGGPGWLDDDPGDWGWSEEPIEDDGPPYRRPRILQLVAIATVLAVVLGSIGTWVVFLAVGSPQPSFAVSSVRVGAPDAAASTSAGGALVTFVVSNRSDASGTAVCRATLSTGGTTVGARRLRLPSLRGGQSGSVAVRVPLDATALGGRGPASVRVACASVSAATR